MHRGRGAVNGAVWGLGKPMFFRGLGGVDSSTGWGQDGGMCGRFTITHPDEAIARLFDAVIGNDLPPVPRFNVCPTTPVAVAGTLMP